MAGLVKASESENANVARAVLGILRTNKLGFVGCLQVVRLGLAAVIEIRPLIVALDTQQQQKATLTAQADEVQDMFSELARGLTSVDVNGARPFILTDSESIQPNPCAPSKTCSQRHRVISERVDACSELKDWYEAFGRLIGGALWHGKTLPVPISRFF